MPDKLDEAERRQEVITKVVMLYRWLFWRCMDCGAKLEPHPLTARGDVCQKCFDDFNGMTIEELMS